MHSVYSKVFGTPVYIVSFVKLNRKMQACFFSTDSSGVLGSTSKHLGSAAAVHVEGDSSISVLVAFFKGKIF